MTWPNPPQLPNPPHTVQLKPCCLAVLVNEECDCAEMAAQFQAAFASPIRWQVSPNGVEATR